MMTDGQSGSARVRFPLRIDDNDYSGMDLDSVFSDETKALSHAFFNGITIKNSFFRKTDLDQCEFGEAHVYDTNFIDCSFAGSDLVRSLFSNVIFEDCDFTDGEWREATFINVKFTRCKFSHTTINLCQFNKCNWEEGSIDGLDYRAVNYNIFSHSVFERGISNEVVLSRNFGLMSANPPSALVKADSRISLEQICFISSYRVVAASELVASIANECANFHGRLRKIRLEFIGNIVKYAAAEKLISAGSLVYIEALISSLASMHLEDGDSQSIILTFATIRNSLLDLVNKITLDDSVLDGFAEKISIVYPGTLTAPDGEILASSLDQIITGGEEQVRLVAVRHGSTIFDIDIQQAIYTAVSVAAGINLLLAQAKISIKTVKSINAELKRRKPSSRKSRELKISNNTTPAMLLSGSEPIELVRLRKVVRQNGAALVKLDEPVKATLYVREGDTMVKGD